MITYSKEYQERLREEIKLLEEKQKLLNEQSNLKTALPIDNFRVLLNELNNKIDKLNE
jgi:hypothetical protein